LSVVENVVRLSRGNVLQDWHRGSADDNFDRFLAFGIARPIHNGFFKFDRIVVVRIRPVNEPVDVIRVVVIGPAAIRGYADFRDLDLRSIELVDIQKLDTVEQYLIIGFRCGGKDDIALLAGLQRKRIARQRKRILNSLRLLHKICKRAIDLNVDAQVRLLSLADFRRWRRRVTIATTSWRRRQVWIRRRCSPGFGKNAARLAEYHWQRDRFMHVHVIIRARRGRWRWWRAARAATASGGSQAVPAGVRDPGVWVCADRLAIG
jgi:hypothetical protein